MDKGKFIEKIKQLGKEDFELVYKAKQFLSSIGSNPEEAVSALIIALSDSDVNIRLMSACTLSRIAPHTSEAVVTLIKALRDKDPRVRFWVIRAIGAIGPYAKEASKVLEVMLKDDRYKSHHKEIVTTLKKIRESLPEAYCIKCRTKREVQIAAPMTFKNGRSVPQWVCPVCGTKLFRISKSKPVARIDTIAPPMEEPIEWRVPPRYVNTCFAHQDNEHTVVNKNINLAQDTWYDLRIDIGPLSLDSVVRNPRKHRFPVEQLPPTQDGHWLEIGAVSADFEIPQGRHHLFLPKTGPSWVCNCMPGNAHSCNDNSRQSYLFIPIKSPSSAGKANLRLGIYYNKNLVQSQKFTFEISIDEQVRKGYYATIDYTLTHQLREVDYLPPRTLNIAHNQNRDRTHTLMLNHDKDDIIGFTVTEGQMKEALDCVRTTLRNIHFEESGGTLLLPEVNRENRYSKSNAKPIDEFKEDLRELAIEGFRLYSCLFGNKPTTEENLTESLKNTIDEPPTIQISRTGNSNFVFPWDLLYDIHLEPTNINEFKYCDLLNEWDRESSIVKNGAYRCPHESSHGKNTICPFGFWGFKYAIEQPPFVEDRPLPVTIQRGKLWPEMLIGLSSKPTKKSLAGNHIKTVREILSDFYIFDTEKKNRLVVRMKSSQLDIIYFFGHGRYENKESPDKGITYLEMADGYTIVPEDIKTWAKYDWPEGHWRHNSPLVLLNGCHTAELTPKALVNFVDMFARAYASGLIGTEITIAEQVAIEAAEVFLDCFKDNAPVKAALNKMRKQFLAKGNLLGLAYTAYCSMDLTLS